MRKSSAGTDSPSGKEPHRKPGLLGGAVRASPSLEPATDFPAAYRRLCELRNKYGRESKRAIDRLHKMVTTKFQKLGGDPGQSRRLFPGLTKAEQAYLGLREKARLAQSSGDLSQAHAIRQALEEFDRIAVNDLHKLSERHGLAPVPAPLSPQQELPGRPAEPAAADTTPATGVTESPRLTETPAVVPRPSAPDLATAAGAVIPPPVIDPWSSLPGPSSRIMPTATMTGPVPSATIPSGRQAPEVPGHGRPSPGGADVSLQPTAQESEFPTAHRRMRELRSVYSYLSRTEIASDFKRAIDRLEKRVIYFFWKTGGEVEQPHSRQRGLTKAELVYIELRKTADRLASEGDSSQAGKILLTLKEIDNLAANELKLLLGKHGVPETPLARPTPRPTLQPVREPSAPTTSQFDWASAYRRVHGLWRHFCDIGDDAANQEFKRAVRRIEELVRRKFKASDGTREDLAQLRFVGCPAPVRQYRVLMEKIRQAEASNDEARALEIRQARAAVDRSTSEVLDRLGRRYGSLDELAARAHLASHRPPEAVETAVAPETEAVTGTPPLQTVQPVPAPVTVPPGSDPHRSIEGVQPPEVAATLPGTAPASPRPFFVPVWLDDDFAVERALIAGELPPGFDASGLIVEAGAFAQFGLAQQLAAGQLPMQTINLLIEGFQTTDEEGGNELFIEYLSALKENITRALRAAYPERVDPEWLDQVRELLHRRTETAAASAVEPAIPQREAIVRRFMSEDALLDAESALQTGGAGALGWSATRWRGVLDDLRQLNATARTDPAAAAAMADIDWNAIEALAGILDIPPPSP